jgi:Tfp pilus assembly protein PilF
VALAALLAFGVFSLTGRAGSFAHAPPPEAQRLYAEGSEAWEKRTPGSLNQALDDFNGALRIDPNYAEAYVGLAKTFNLLRQYTLMPDSQAYPLARQAAEHALELNERLPEAHAALAFADYWGFWDETAARREFERAIALDPDSATSHHWYATFLNSTGDFDASLREIRRAQALDPNSMSIRADSGFLLAQAGQPAAGIATLKAVEATDPGFVSPHTYLRNIYFNLGPDQAYLQEDAFLADSTHDPAQQSEVVAARQGYATGGRRGMLQALLSVRLERARVGAASAYSVARLYGLLDEKPLALSWLQRAIAKRETDLTSLRGDLAFQNMRKDPVFEAVAGEFKPA